MRTDLASDLRVFLKRNSRSVSGSSLRRVWHAPGFSAAPKRCNGRPAASTTCKVLQSGELPRRLEVIDAIVAACGGTEGDEQRSATAWHRLVQPAPKAGPSLGNVMTGPGSRRSPASS